MTEQEKVWLLLEALAEKRALQEVIRLDKEKARDSVLTAEIRQALADIDTEFADGEEAAMESIVGLEASIKTATLGIGETVKGATLYAVFSKPRVSWDTKGLGGYAIAHPEIEQFRKQGKPSISIRMANKK